MKTSAVLFDMDGVLFESNTGHSLAFNKIFSGLGIRSFKYDSYKGMATRDVIRLILTKHNIFFNDQILENLANKKSIISTKINSNFKVNPETFEVLNFLRSLEIPIGLVTSASKNSMTSFIDKNNIRKFFRVMISADDVSFSKPNPEPYNKAIKDLAVDPELTIVVEDSNSGIKSALAANTNVIFYSPSGTPCSYNSPTIKKLTAIKNFINT
jgi:HAD superfamily hydrolase (TIGR01509 family)